MGNNNDKEAGAGAGAGDVDANANLQELRQNLEQLQGLLLQGRNHDNDPEPPARPPIVGDVCFVDVNPSGYMLAKILEVKDNQVTTRLVGTDCVNSKPITSVQNISKIRCPATNMDPYYEGPNPNWNAQQVRDQQRKHREERDHAPDTLATYQYEDEEIIFNVLRNNIQRNLMGDGNVNRRPALAWCFKWNLLMYRLSPGNEFLERMRARLNHEVCLPVGFELVFLGGDPVRGKKYVGFIMEEREIPEEN